MNLSQDAFNSLIDTLYQTLEDYSVWNRFYDDIATVLDVHIVHMLGIDKAHGALSYSDGTNMPAHGELSYIQNYHFSDPRVPIVLGSEPMSWTHCHEVLDEVFVANDPFYQEFLIPYGLRYMSACKVVDDENAIVIFSTLRRPEQGPLGSDAIDFLNKLMPHVARVCKLSVKNFIYSTQALVGHALINKLRQPVVLTTLKGHVVHANEAAQSLFFDSNIVRIQNNQLTFPGKFAQQFEQECQRLEQLFFINGEVNIDAKAEFSTIKVSSKNTNQNEISIYAFISMLIPQQIMGTFGLRPLVMVFFYHPESTASVDPSLISAAFGLSPAECRIAVMLADGYALKEIAKELDIQFDTVRKQLQSIYQKTSTNRQPELIRLLLNLPSNAFRSINQ